MTTRGWLYVIILVAILAFIFRPAFAALVPFDSEAFSHGFKDTFFLGRSLGIEAPGRWDYDVRDPSLGWMLAGGFVGSFATVIPIWSMCMLFLWKIRGERNKARRARNG